MKAFATSPDATTVCRLTAGGRSAIAVVGLAGPEAADHLGDCFRTVGPAAMQIGQIRYGTWLPTGESVVVTPIQADRFEIHAHGGSAAVAGITNSLIARGARPGDPLHWGIRGKPRHSMLTGDSPGPREERAETAETSEPLIAEALAAVLASRTLEDAAPLHDQLDGLLVDWVIRWQRRAFSPLDRPSLAELRETASGIAQCWPQVQLLLRPRRVVLFGPPNVGKSSLLNRLVGYGRTITHDVAGTTRDVIDCDTVLDGVPITLTDTAGIRDADNAIEREGIRRGRGALQQSDLVICVVDPSHLTSLPDLLQRAVVSGHDRHRCLTVLNKADQLSSADAAEATLPPGVLPTVALGGVGPAVLPTERPAASKLPRRPGVSPIVGDGIEELMGSISDTFRSLRPPRHVPLPVNLRQSEALQRLALAENARQASRALETLRNGGDGDVGPTGRSG